MSESERTKLPTKYSRLGFFALVGPGILIAATGVGAGDLATAAFSGSQLGLTVLWAVLLGSGFKFLLNEGLTRYQLATGETLLQGAMTRLGWIAKIVFGSYLLLWTFFVASSLMSACGVALHAIWPVFEDAGRAKIIFGVAHSLLGVALVRLGGFALFEKFMTASIGLMFGVVVVTAVLLKPDLSELIRGMVIPQVSTESSAGIQWTIALMGGIGGTLTVLCYGYWIREKGRHGVEALKACRLDLAVGYLVTAIFGVAMVVIGSQIVVDGKGASLVVDLANRLQEPLGSLGRWAFLIGAWGAIFSSLLGVWQAVPYVFSDYLGLLHTPKGGTPPTVHTKSRSYRAYLWALALVPMLGLQMSFKDIQKVYAIFGAAFMPLLALTLLILMNDKSVKKVGLENHWSTNAVLVGILIFFCWAGYHAVYKVLA